MIRAIFRVLGLLTLFVMLLAGVVMAVVGVVTGHPEAVIVGVLWFGVVFWGSAFMAEDAYELSHR